MRTAQIKDAVEFICIYVRNYFKELQRVSSPANYFCIALVTGRDITDPMRVALLQLGKCLSMIDACALGWSEPYSFSQSIQHSVEKT